MDYRKLVLLRIDGISFVRDINDLPIEYSEGMHLTLNCMDSNDNVFRELDLKTLERSYREKENASVWFVEFLHKDEDKEAIKAAFLASENWNAM